MALVQAPGPTGYLPKPTAPASPTLFPGITASNANYQNQQINQLAKLYQGVYQGDETYQGQLRNLQAQLQGQWTGPGGVVPQAQQLALAYGGALPAGVANFNTPTFGGQQVGTSLLQALSDPTLMSNAQSNPFSTLNTIAQQLQGANISRTHAIGGRGLGRSGAVNALLGANEYQAQRGRYDAANQFMSALSGLYGGFMGNLDTAAQTQSGYLNDAFGRAKDLIGAGVYGTPTAAKSAAAPRAKPVVQPIAPKTLGIHGGMPSTLSTNTGLPQYKPTSQYLIGPHGRTPLGSEGGMYHMGSGFKITPRGRALY